MSDAKLEAWQEAGLIDAATAASSVGIDEQLARYSDELSRSSGAQRAAIEMAIRATEAERGRLELELRQARARENDLSRALAREEDRWGDLLARLERLTQ